MTTKSTSEEQDQALAAYTDALLEGREAGLMPDKLAATVDRLAQALPPEAPPEALRQCIRRQVRGVWEETRAPWWAGPVEVWRALCRSLSRRPAWGALVALVIVGLLVTLVVPGGLEVMGTAVSPATGAVPGAAWVLLPVALIVAVVVIRSIRRR